MTAAKAIPGPWFDPFDMAMTADRGRGRGHRRAQGRGAGRGGPNAGFPGGPGFGRRRAKVGRGDVRAAVLLVLADEPLHGYQIIQEISERTAGAWRPSPGSIYPIVAQLESDGLVRIEKSHGRRVVHLTDAGVTYVHDNAEALNAVWDHLADGESAPVAKPA